MDITINNGVNLDDTRSKKYILYGAVALRLYMNLVSLGLIVSLPVIVKGFDAMDLYPVVSVSYTAMLAITSLVGGRLGVFLGRKATIIMALSGIMIGSAACAFAPNLLLFLVGYIAFGLTYGVSLSMPIALLCDVSTIQERPKYMGIYTSANNVGMVIGPFLGGFVTDTFGFMYTPIYPIPLAIIALFLLAKYYPRHVKQDHNMTFDYYGVILLALGIAPFVIGLSLGGSVLEWNSLGLIALIAGGVFFSVMFVLYEKKTKHPLLAVNLFKVKSFTIANIMLLLIVPYFSIANNYAVLFVQDGLGLSATISGTLAIPKTVSVLVLAAFLGKWISQNPQHQKKLIILSGVVIGLGELIIALTAGTSTALPFLFSCMVLFGIGELLYFMNLQPYMQSELSEEDVHAAMSIQSFSTVMGICIMSAIFGVILNASSGDIISSFPIMSIITVGCSAAFVAVGAISLKNQNQQ